MIVLFLFDLLIGALLIYCAYMFARFMKLQTEINKLNKDNSDKTIELFNELTGDIVRINKELASIKERQRSALH